MNTSSRLLALVFVALMSTNPGGAQSPLALERPTVAAYPLMIDRGASGLWQSLQKLQSRASLLMVVAHPDDEDGGMLAYESRGLGADVTLLTLTRGEGGQNVMTGDYWDELGLLRTEELLAAGNAYGVRQRFTRLADFGFSKSLEESLKVWGYDRVLYDVVREIRLTRPLVVTSVFAGNVSDGHGHHQTAGMMAQEAYRLAGDPTVFPDQIAAGLKPWSPLKVYARAPFARVSEKGIFDYATGHYAPVRFKNYVTGAWMEGVPAVTVNVPEGSYNPLFGRSYLALAREGLSEQKSQNDGVGIPPAGPSNSGYHLYASRVAPSLPIQENGFFDGIDTTLTGIADYVTADRRELLRKRLAAVAVSVEKAAASFDAAHPEKAAAPLADGLRQTRALRSELSSLVGDELARYNMDHELAIKEAQFNLALAQSLGISLVATLEPANAGKSAFPLGPMRGNQPTPQSVIAGQPFSVNLHVANQGSQNIAISVAKLQPAKGDWKIAAKNPVPEKLAAGQAFDAAVAATVPSDAPPTQTYFARPDLEQPYYDLSRAEDLGMPTSSYPLSAHLAYNYNGVEGTIDAVVQSVHRVNVLGPVLEPLLVAPAVSVAITPGHGIVPLSADHLDINVVVRNHATTPQKGKVELKLPAGWSSEPASFAFSLAREGEEIPVHFRVTPRAIGENRYLVQAQASVAGKLYTSSFTPVGYAGLRPLAASKPAVFTATGVAVKTAPALRVGYVMGPGDEVATALAQLDIHPVELAAADLASSDLSRFDAIVVGIRAYTTRADLRANNGHLLEYVKAGGTVIVEYQTAEFDRNYGPYELSVPADAEKVVEENSPVEFDAHDPLLSWPNKIGEADFTKWVEERGHGFASKWASEFHAPTSMHDADQTPQRGGLLWARSGKGIYIYAAYAFFREMPEGVPGAFRIFANLLSAGKNPEIEAEAH